MGEFAMPDLPLPSQTDVTIQNQTTGQIDYLKYQGSTLTGSVMFDYGLGSEWKIVADASFTLVAQNSTGFVDFLNFDLNGNLVSSQMSAVAVPHIFGSSFEGGVLGSQLANGQLDFLQFDTSTGALIGSDLVTTPVPKAVSISAPANGAISPAWAELGTGLGSFGSGDIVDTQTADGSPDMIGFSGSIAARDLAVNSSFFISAPGTPTFFEANPDSGRSFNLQDGSGTPQGLQEIAQTANGQIDALYYDTGVQDPVASNEGILYASNMLGSFPGWQVVQAGFIIPRFFPIS
jgi:hypothetical protein